MIELVFLNDTLLLLVLTFSVTVDLGRFPFHEICLSSKCLLLANMCTAMLRLETKEMKANNNNNNNNNNNRRSREKIIRIDFCDGNV